MANTVTNQSGHDVYLKNGKNSEAEPLRDGESRTGDYDGYWDPTNPDQVYKFHDYVDVTIETDGPDPFGPDPLVEIEAGWKGDNWINDHGDWNQFQSNAVLMHGGGGGYVKDSNKWTHMSPSPMEDL